MRRAAALLLLLAACGGGVAGTPQAIPTPALVYVTVTVTPEPTPTPSADIRVAWFESACDAAFLVDQGTETFIDLVIRGPSDLLDLFAAVRSTMASARDAIDALPQWEAGEPFAEQALITISVVENELAALERGGDADASGRAVVAAHNDLIDAAGQVSEDRGVVGCGLEAVIY